MKKDFVIDTNLLKSPGSATDGLATNDVLPAVSRRTVLLTLRPGVSVPAIRM
jgi:hypothetical protein